MSTEKETTFCTHKGYNTVAPCDDSCFSQHSQSESIEWKDRKYEFEVLTSYESPYAGKSSIQHQAYREGASKMFDVLLPHLKQAITTTLAKRDAYLVENIPNGLHEYARWILTEGKDSSPLQRKSKKEEIALQIIKH